MSASRNRQAFSQKASLDLAPHPGEIASSDHSEFQPDAAIAGLNTESQAAAKLRETTYDPDHPRYILNDPAGSNGEADQRVPTFRELEEHYSKIHGRNPSAHRVSDPGTEGLRVLGRLPPLRRESIYEEAQFIRFDEACRRGLSRNRVNYVAEPLCDGVDVELIYRAGRLVQAYALDETRISGDITAHMKSIKEVPLRLNPNPERPLPPHLVVHGKIYMTKSDFSVMNERLGRKTAGQKFFANPRDAVVGLLRQAACQEMESSPLRMFVQDVVGAPKNDFTSHWELLQGLLGWGFTINVERVQLCTGAAGAIGYYKTIAGERESLPYAVNGVVYRVDPFSDGIAVSGLEETPQRSLEYRFASSHHDSGANRHERIKRFQKQEVIYHWVQGLPFLLLLMSGSGILISKFNQLDPKIVNTLRLFHKITATSWVIGVIVTFFFIGFKFHLVNLRQMLTWTRDDFKWMILSALVVFDSKIKVPDAGKFNPGQKINMLVVIGYFFGFAATGLLMWFRGTILISWYVHVALFFQALGSLGGHLYLSFIHPSTRIGLGGIFHGWVPKKYVEHHHPLTLKLDEAAKSLDPSLLFPEITKER